MCRNGHSNVNRALETNCVGLAQCQRVVGPDTQIVADWNESFWQSRVLPHTLWVCSWRSTASGRQCWQSEVRSACVGRCGGCARCSWRGWEWCCGWNLEQQACVDLWFSVQHPEDVVFDNVENLSAEPYTCTGVWMSVEEIKDL